MPTKKLMNGKNGGKPPKDDPNSPVDSTMEVIERILNKMGPVYTSEQRDSQEHNLGPKDGLTELNGLPDKPEPKKQEVNEPDEPKENNAPKF